MICSRQAGDNVIKGRWALRLAEGGEDVRNTRPAREPGSPIPGDAEAKRLERSWAEVFRNEALPLIDRFAPMAGRPNRAVQQRRVKLEPRVQALAPRPAARHRGDPPAPEDPRTVMQHDWPAGFPGDHGPDHPGAGHTHRKATAGLHPHHEQHRYTHPWACSVRRMRLFLRALRWEHPPSSPCGSGGPPGALFEGRRQANYVGDATSTGWCSVARLLPSWRSTGCWSGCSGAVRMWAGTGARVT